MAKYYFPKRGKRDLAESQDIILKKGEMFVEIPQGTTMGHTPGKIVIGDGGTNYSSIKDATTSSEDFQPLITDPSLYMPIFVDDFEPSSIPEYRSAKFILEEEITSDGTTKLPAELSGIKKALWYHQESIDYNHNNGIKNIVSNGEGTRTFTATRLDDSTFSFNQTWRPVVNELSSTNSTTESLSAYQGYVLQRQIDELPNAMVFCGSLGEGGTISQLPTASSSNIGNMYKVITAGTYDGQAAKAGDLFISDGSTWIYIPSADEPSGTVTSVKIENDDGDLSITGSQNPITSSGTINIKHSNSVIEGTASEGGSSRTLAFSGTFNIPSVTYDSNGHITGKGRTTLTMPAKPTYTAADVGAATYDHIHDISISTSTATNQRTLAASTKYALTAGGSTYVFTTPPDNNTTYSNATTSTAGLMSASDKKKLNGIEIDGISFSTGRYSAITPGNDISAMNPTGKALLNSGMLAVLDNIQIFSSSTSTAIRPTYIDFRGDTNPEGGSGYSARILHNANNFTDNENKKLYFKYGGSGGGNLILVCNSIEQSSDRRLKTNITNLDNKYIELLNKLEVKEFNFINDLDVPKIGFIAQDVEEALKEIGIEGDKIPFINKDNEDYYTLDYTELNTILWKICQKQEQRIEKLESEISEIKALLSK